MNFFQQSPELFIEVETNIYDIKGFPHLQGKYDEEIGYSIFPRPQFLDDWFEEFYHLENLEDLLTEVSRVNIMYAEWLLDLPSTN